MQMFNLGAAIITALLVTLFLLGSGWLLLLLAHWVFDD